MGKIGRQIIGLRDYRISKHAKTEARVNHPINPDYEVCRFTRLSGDNGGDGGGDGGDAGDGGGGDGGSDGDGSGGDGDGYPGLRGFPVYPIKRPAGLANLAPD